MQYKKSVPNPEKRKQIFGVSKFLIKVAMMSRYLLSF